ncbi:molybdopterin-dependent oxidoreductase [Natronobacterium gregoryi]|uniref:Nitrate reductase n=2 Tax=Natronobacterium gregoryi TaxID=44930 RepID=L0AMI1_NATGS|nr:molybdopterin-dependent oxidoreductase [Natronobacterium gregoryi]AFZ74265.1 sulfite oxidase-like oxidoreductase [Natronobacterium gregoryi SP2]ELY63723.1 nitrate reductase / sulfite dehydrogenase (nitrate/ sulfite:cytochrome C oxidoreductase protein) [Natronobacterium gregoryi SP2]PLK21952.1 nitrate reductase [Natronobacterium gregoryi SP2]SFI52632.1 Mo-co oxidoreductase dimerisation domain-containing protein [Natronobacterium gregoryi]
MRETRLVAIVTLLAAGISSVATSFGIYATSERFLVSSFNRLVLEVLPGWFVSTFIQVLGDLALELSMLFSGAILSVVVGAVAVGGYRLGASIRPSSRELAGTVLAVALVFVVTYPVVGAASAVVLPAIVGGAVVAGFDLALTSNEPTGDVRSDRRVVVQAVGAVAAYNVVAHGLGFVRRSQTRRSERELQGQATRREAEHLVAEANDAGIDADGIKPLISEIGEFYRVDINPTPPTVDADAWNLSVTGLVDEELELEYDDIRGYETINQYKAIRCLSDGIDGEQLDTAVWTGCRMGDVLEDAGVQEDGEYAMVRGVDDYFYSIPLEDLADSLLAFGMNGMELPAGHGYPVRLLVPDRWGKLHVKWLTDVEIVGEEAGGYWEERGWNGMGPVNAVTKVDRINRPDDGRIQLVGHAYAGARGVEAVELSIDGGDSWEEATLSEPLPDPDTTRQWRYEIDPSADDPDSYDVYARTIDGEGTVQPEERTDPYPDGATGWAQRTVRRQ